MRTKTFLVPKSLIALFFDQVDDSGLETSITELTEEEALVVNVHYEESEREEVMNLVELIDDDTEPENEPDEEEEEPEIKPKRKPSKKTARR